MIPDSEAIVLSASERVYAALLWLYPPGFRRRFGNDMRELFRDCYRETVSGGGAGALARLWARVVVDLFTSVIREYAVTVRGDGDAGSFTLQTAGADLRYSWRTLAKSPSFTITAVVAIALGSGAVTTIFSAANASVLRGIPGIERSHDLVDIGRAQPGSRGSLTPSYPYYERIRSNSRTLTGVSAWTMMPLTISSGAEGVGAFGNLVSANYFTVLGVRPALGRFFTADEDRGEGSHAVIVLSHALWTRRFGADSAVLGRSITVNGAPYTVIGVTPPRFNGLFPIARTDAWVPIMMADQLRREPGLLRSAGSGWLSLVGRLREGTSLAQARAELVAIATAHASEDPSDMRGFTDVTMSRVTGFPADASSAIHGFVAVLFAISSLVLVIACVNVASMLLARGITRRREIALRLALGAARGRLVRQLVTESVVLSFAGAIGGLLITIWGTRLLSHVPLPAEVPLSIDFSPDYRVLAFALATALVTGVIFGLAPALQATRTDHVTALRSDSAAAGTRRSRLRDGLVIGQMALSLLLLMSAGLFVRALGRGQQVDPGVNVDHVVTAAIDVSSSGYTDERARVFYQQLADRLKNTAGVTAVSYTRWVPLTNSSAGTDVRLDRDTPAGKGADATSTNVNFAVVGPAYFDVMRLPLVRGRPLLPTDHAGAPHVAVVNEQFARTVWPGQDPLGKVFHHEKSEVTVVGVARDAKYSSLNEELRPFMYLPLAQNWESRINLLVRTSADEGLLAPIIHDAVRNIDPLLPVPEVLTMRAATSVVLLPQRVAAAITGAMGLVGLVLAAVGLYGVVGYSVSQRTREIGVRMALGASQTNVLGLVVRDGMRLAITGSAIGVALAFALTRVMTRLLFGVSPLDPVVFAWIPAGLGAVSLLATYLPARKAASTDPLVALKTD